MLEQVIDFYPTGMAMMRMNEESFRIEQFDLPNRAWQFAYTCDTILLRRSVETILKCKEKPCFLKGGNVHREDTPLVVLNNLGCISFFPFSARIYCIYNTIVMHSTGTKRCICN